MRNNSGFTLLEVLIAVFILSVGLLGLAKLQTVSLQNTYSANLRTVATQMAYEMTDRIRANKAGFDLGSYNRPTLGTIIDCATTTCNITAMAQYDINQFNTALASELVGGHGVVCQDNTPNDGTGDTNNDGLSAAEDACDGIVGSSAGMNVNIYVVKVWWQDDRANPASLKRLVIPFVP